MADMTDKPAAFPYNFEITERGVYFLGTWHFVPNPLLAYFLGKQAILTTVR